MHFFVAQHSFDLLNIASLNIMGTRIVPMNQNIDPETAETPITQDTSAVSALNASIHAPSYGMRLGTGIRHWWCHHKRSFVSKLIVFLIVLFVIYVIYAIASNENENVSTFQAIRHHACKKRGGCSASCPFIASDDPRLIMKLQTDSIHSIYASMRDGTNQDVETIDEITAKFSKNDKITEIKTTLNGLITVKTNCLNNVSAYYASAKALSDKYSAAETVTKDLIDAKNRVSTFDSLASVNAVAFVSVMMQMDAYAKVCIIEAIPNIDQVKINNFDGKIHEVRSNLLSIDDVIQSQLFANINSNEYRNAAMVVQDTTSNSESIIAAMSNSFNMAEKFRDIGQHIVAKYTVISDVYSHINRKIEGFNNSLPNRLGSSDIDTLISEGDYNTALIKTALEPEIVKNHLKFASERASFDSGGGVPSVRDDENDLNPWVGIFGRPTYRHTDGSSADTGSQPLKSIPSDNPSDMMRIRTPRWSVV